MIHVSMRAGELLARSADDDPDRELTYAELARFLGVHIRSATRWHKLGVGPPMIKYGHQHYRFKIRDVRAWLARMVAEKQQHGVLRGGAR